MLFLLLLKLPPQLIGFIKRPEIFIASISGERFYVYLSIALASEFRIEIRIRDLLFFCRHLPFGDFLFRTVILLPGKNIASPLVLSRDVAHRFSSQQTILIDEDYYSSQRKSAPNYIMPHSHNIIEAMMAGAIPITNYGHFFDPPLQNGVNCLSFANYEELDQALRQAMTMSVDQVDAMRRETLDYYQRHLEPSVFSANFRLNYSPSMKLLVNAERGLLPGNCQ